jgi:uncharacterized membrane protein
MEGILLLCFSIGLFLVIISFRSPRIQGDWESSKKWWMLLFTGTCLIVASILYYLKLNPPLTVLTAFVAIILLVLATLPFTGFFPDKDEKSLE